MDHFLNSGALISTRGDKLRIGRGKKNWHEVQNSRFSYYFPTFFLDDRTPWLTFEETEEISIDSLLSHLKKIPHQTPSTEWTLSDFDPFQDQFIRFMQSRLQKVVPYGFAHAETELTESNLNHCLIHLLEYAKKNPVSIYGFWGKGNGILGATPEILFTMENQMVSTMALAGTSEDVQSLMGDPKQRKEHDFVIEGIAQSLQSFGKVVIGETKPLALSHLAHLFTPIQLKTQGEFTALTQSLHPTPALGVFPKSEGKQWLKNYQTLVPRGRFGAPVGYAEQDTGRCYVAIRNVQWKNQRLQIGAGCGIVKESIMEKEWKELALKIKATRAMLAL